MLAKVLVTLALVFFASVCAQTQKDVVFEADQVVARWMSTLDEASSLLSDNTLFQNLLYEYSTVFDAQIYVDLEYTSQLRSLISSDFRYYSIDVFSFWYGLDPNNLFQILAHVQCTYSTGLMFENYLGDLIQTFDYISQFAQQEFTPSGSSVYWDADDLTCLVASQRAWNLARKRIATNKKIVVNNEDSVTVTLDYFGYQFQLWDIDASFEQIYADGYSDGYFHDLEYWFYDYDYYAPWYGFLGIFYLSWVGDYYYEDNWNLWQPRIVTGTETYNLVREGSSLVIQTARSSVDASIDLQYDYFQATEVGPEYALPFYWSLDGWENPWYYFYY